jgi:O-antigen/teichoic acid export membrane protein
MFSPADLGLFVIYLSVVNILGPLVGLRFESALFGAADRSVARLIFRLSITTVALTTALASGLIVLGVDHLFGEASPALQSLRAFLPFGLFAAGLYDPASAWAIKCDDMKTLAIARFAQPFVLALLQVLFGLFALPAEFLVVAHIGSYAAYVACILLRTMTREDVAGIIGAPLREIAAEARRDIKFPLYSAPALLITVLIGNLPPILMGSLFGADVAGNYGMAYRIVVGPLTIIGYPLSNIFTSEASGSKDPAGLRTAARFMFAVSLLFVALPAVLFGLVAPQLAPLALGREWVLVGRIASALAIMAAAQALAAPFSEVTSIYRRQEVRFLVDLLRLFLAFAPLIWGALAGWDALFTIRLMAAGGTIGFLVSLAASAAILRTAIRRMEEAKAAAAP